MKKKAGMPPTQASQLSQLTAICCQDKGRCLLSSLPEQLQD